MNRSQPHEVYLGLGSNLGDREGHLRKAVALIEERVGHVARQSSVIETAPWGFASANNFLNAVILCLTDKTPREVLQLTQQIEREMGRKQKSVTAECQPSKPYSGQSRQDERQAPKYADRPIDIDILLYDNLKIDDSDLKIPHPLMHEREFVMKPLREIRP